MVLFNVWELGLVLALNLNLCNVREWSKNHAYREFSIHQIFLKIGPSPFL